MTQANAAEPAPLNELDAEIASYYQDQPTEPTAPQAPSFPSGYPSWIEAQYDVTRNGLRPKQVTIDRVLDAVARCNANILSRSGTSWDEFLVQQAEAAEFKVTVGDDQNEVSLDECAEQLAQAFTLAQEALEQVAPTSLRIAFNIRDNLVDALANRAYDVHRHEDALRRAHAAREAASRNGRDAPDTSYVEQVAEARMRASLLAGMWVKVARSAPIGQRPLDPATVDISWGVRQRLMSQARFLERQQGAGAAQAAPEAF